MKTSLFFIFILVLFSACKKKEVKNNSTTSAYEVPETISEATSMIHGFWTCDSSVNYGPSGYISTEQYPSFLNFDNGLCTSDLINNTFQYTFLNPTTIYIDIWGNPTYNTYFSDSDQITIMHLTTNAMILKCVHTYFIGGAVAKYDVRYYHR